MENVKRDLISEFLRGAIELFFSLYAVALTCSMAGMEMCAWLTAMFFGFYALWDRGRTLKFHKLRIETPLILLVFIVFIGLKLNAPPENFIYAMGRMRNFALLYIFAYSFQIMKDLRRILMIV